MRAGIKPASLGEVCFNPLYLRVPESQRKVFDEFLGLSQHMWVGRFDGEAACIFGVICPTMLSDTAYLWLHCDQESVAGNQFLFIRYSQRVMDWLLEEYTTVVGYTHVDARKSIRWLKWLGARFGEPDGKRIPFCIRRKHG